MSVGYNKYANKYNRFQEGYEESRAGGKASVGAGAEIYKYLANKEGGLWGRMATQGTDPAFGSLTEAISARGAGDANAAGLIQKAYEGVAPDDWNKAVTNFAQQNVGTPGQEGVGFLGGVQKIGKGLDTLTGGYAGKAAGAAGDFAMKYGGQAIKDFGKKAVGNLAQSALGEGVKAIAGGVSAVAGPVLMAKQVVDFANQTVDAYEELESGVEAGGHGLVDLTLQRKGAKDLMKHQNKAIARTIEENRGKVKETIGGPAEKVLTAYDAQAGKSNLETDMGDARRDDISEKLATTYSDSSTALRKQRENLQLTNVEGYRRQNQGLMQAESAVQASIDDMKDEMDDMELAYKGSKALTNLWS